MTQTQDVMPVQDLRAAHELLARPFMPAAAEFMVISAKQGNPRAAIATYLSRTSIEDRLDLVVGSDNWEAVPIPHAECVGCQLTIFGTTKASLGQGSDRRAQEANAFKRAARSFGVGRYLYTRPRIWKPIGDGSMAVRLSKGGAWIPSDLEHQLRKEYAQYLREAAIPDFGAPIDHKAANGAARQTPASPPSSPSPTASNGNGSGAAPNGTGNGAPAPLNGNGNGSQANGNGAQNAGGKPEAMVTNGNGSVPADPQVRDRLQEAIEKGGFGREAVGNVAELLYGEGVFDRLATPQMGDLIDAIDLAREGQFTDETLGGLAGRGLEQPDRPDARKEFIAYVARVAKRQREARQ
jgi:hypothetical protein